MLSCKTIKFFLLFFFWVGLGFSQNYPVRHYSASNELPNNAIRSLLVDSNNILWIGTENGIVRKENDVLKYFFEEDGLALNSCWAIAEDKTGKLWFGSYGEGISVYDGIAFKLISEKDGLVHNEVTKLFTSGDFMYVGTSDGVSVVDINSLEVISLNTLPDDELFRVQDFFRDDNEIYVATYGSGIFKIHNEDNNPILLKVKDHKNIYSVLKDKDSIYSSNKGFYTKSSLSDYVDKKDLSSEEKHGASIIWEHVKTNDNRIFAAAWGIYDSNGGIYELVDNQMISRASEFNMDSKEVFSLAYDSRFEKLYAGTLDDGVFEIALNPQIKFQQVKGKEIIGFAKTQNSSLLLLNNGILLKGVDHQKTIPLLQLKKWQETYVLNTRLPLPEHKDHFYELNYSTKAPNINLYDIKAFGNIYWINTNIGVFAINEEGDLYHYLPLHSEEINFTEAGNLIETNPYGGVRIYSDLEAFKYQRFEPEDPSTPTMVVNSLQKGSKTYFLSVFSGLYVWENNEFRSYHKSGIWKEKKLRHISPLEENLAIANEFGDVFIVNDEISFKIIKKIPRAKIQGNSIAFLEQYQGTLIIGTEKGLTLYESNRFIFLDKEQGLGQPLLSGEVRENILVVGSNDGYYEIDLDAVRGTKASVDQINLKEIFVNNRPFTLGPAKEHEVNLAHNENSVLLRFRTNAHPYPNKLQYQYRLNPHAEWSLSSSNPEIFLPALPPENYAIDVKVLDKSTGLSYTQPLLTLAIFPPIWKTWWFAVLITTLFLLVVYSIYKFQILQNQRFEEQKRLIQRRFEETKMEALLAQMNPHFIFNAMNSIQYYIMDSNTEKATTFLGDFSKLIRLNLDHCTQPTILLAEEIEYLQSYIRVENTRFNDAIKVIIDIDPSVDIYNIGIPTMLLQSFVENVFVHAFPSGVIDPTLKISFKQLAEGVLQCEIEDNGIGISSTPVNKLHQSRGVNLVKERLALLGYDVEEALQVISAKDKGTSIVLKLKV